MVELNIYLRTKKWICMLALMAGLLLQFLPTRCLAAVEQLPDGVKIDWFEVLKSKREMKVYNKGKLLKTYKIALGLNPVGKKEVQGDYKTPEGIYKIDWKTTQTKYHKALHVSYPNNADRENAKKLGKSPGGDILVHGLPNRVTVDIKDHWKVDWTWGCIAVSNAEIDEIYEHVQIGAAIEMKP